MHKPWIQASASVELAWCDLLVSWRLRWLWGPDRVGGVAPDGGPGIMSCAGSGRSKLGVHLWNSHVRREASCEAPPSVGLTLLTDILSWFGSLGACTRSKNQDVSEAISFVAIWAAFVMRQPA